MSTQPTCSGGVVSLGGGSENSESDQHEKFSYSLISVEDEENLDDPTGTPQSTPNQVRATSTPARNLDLLTNMSSSLFPDMSSP